MEGIRLLPHNEIAYIKLKSFLENEQMASLNHATGTGKSFILLKYLYEHRDKKILFFAPTYPILTQLIEDHMPELGILKEDFKQFDTMIYSNLLSLNDEELTEIGKKYDIVILDEYHRCGAPLWGRKINTILSEIKKHEDKKVIGTTATEIRYLDNERNMNNIIFDGKEASRLTLADAILQGILPAPIYVSYNVELLREIERLEKNINLYLFYDKDKEDYLKKLHEIKKELSSSLNYKVVLKDYLKDCKKFLAFSTNIKRIETDKKIVEDIIGVPENSYVIHSRLSKNHNYNALRSFRHNDEKSVLYSIDILNEGVHVKGVDAVLMLRKTTSPIIYFQQLGRLLSYSRRNDNVVVLDLVNNLKNHKAIYELYQDVVDRAKEYIELDPEHKEKYELILDRFKIVDKTSKICDEIDSLKDIFDKTSLIERRLERAVEILEDPYYPNEIEKTMARVDILKFEKYISLDLYDRIKKLNIEEKPKILSISRDEFIELLSGEKNLKRRFKCRTKNIFKELQYFCDYNNRLPSIFSNNEEEKRLALVVYNNVNNFGATMMSYIYSYVDDNTTLLERICLGMQVCINDYDNLLKQVKVATNNGLSLNQYVYFALNKRLNSDELNIIMKKNKDDEELKELLFDIDYRENDHSNRNFNYNVMFTKQFEEVAKKVLEEIKEANMDKYLKKLFLEISDFIITNNRDLNYYDSISNFELLQKERILFCKKILLFKELEAKGYMETIDDLVLTTKIKQEYMRKEALLSQVISFINSHNGELPSVKNRTDMGEVNLAKSYQEIYGGLSEEQKEKISKLLEENKEQKVALLNEYINFVKTHKRKPVVKGDDYEVELNKRLNRWLPYFTEEEKERLNEALSGINKYDSIRNTYYMLQKKKENK